MLYVNSIDTLWLLQVVNLVKVPVEVVKQRRQTSGLRPLAIMRAAVHNEGFIGLYRGFVTTIIRDIPFSVIQFPLWEAFKVYCQRVTRRDITPTDSALCGALAGLFYFTVWGM